MTSVKTAHLERVDLFQDLSLAELADISEQTALVHYSRDHLFYAPNDPGEALYILKEGRVQLYRMSPDGRKLIVALLEAGAVFGHMALIGQRMHNTFAQAVDDCVVSVWSRQRFQDMLLAKPQVTLRFLEAVGERLFNAEQRLEELAFKRVSARMAALLLRLNDGQGGTGTLNGYTHQYLADMMGTYRETVTQTLNDFKSRGLIRIRRKSIEILDPDGLRLIAEA